MKAVSKSEIARLVKVFSDDQQKWHYHLLTPSCLFNESENYAIYVENLDRQQTYVYYSKVAEMELSNTLAGLLHGKEVMDKNKTRPGYMPSKKVASILHLINELSAAGIKWHHHVFFPGCVFNGHPTKYELVVEDPRDNTPLFSISDQEPKEDLKQIETQFYSQK